MLSYNLQTLINRRGQEATLVKVTTGAYNPSLGSSTNTETTYTVKAYFGNYELADNDSITYGDRRIVLPAKDTSGNPLPEPDSEDIIRGVGDEVVIKRVQKIYNADTLVCYICRAME